MNELPDYSVSTHIEVMLPSFKHNQLFVLMGNTPASVHLTSGHTQKPHNRRKLTPPQPQSNTARMGQSHQDQDPQGGSGLSPSPLEDPLTKSRPHQNQPLLLQTIAHPLLPSGSDSRQARLSGAQTRSRVACPVISECSPCLPPPAPW